MARATVIRGSRTLAMRRQWRRLRAGTRATPPGGQTGHHAFVPPKLAATHYRRPRFLGPPPTPSS